MDEQTNLGLKVEQKVTSVEDYIFEPIKGYPMLNWKGKRPFTTTQFYPAQLKENHSKEVDGWLNKIFWGDNLQVMSHLLKSFRGQIDLIYIDPPFDSKADYKRKIELRGKKLSNDNSTFEEKQYSDIWTNDEYLQFMYERLILLRELLSDTGTIYLHCDWHKVHHLRIMMDEIFGANNFRNEIIWCYTGASNIQNDFPKKHDNILRYSKTDNYYFNKEAVRIPYAEGSLDRANRNVIASGGMNFDKIELNENGKVVEDFWEDIVNFYEIKNDIKSNNPDWWKDIQRATRYPNEPVGYPTQKPKKLLERIISGSSKPGDLIFDCFMGSGTTQTVAMNLGRRFIGADINLGAIQTTTKRLLNISKEINGKLQDETKYTGFSIYNVNHYDVFRNPVEAKDLLIKALEIQPLPNNSNYDGEKDGRMVKIMPINRIATRADLNELVTNFDYKKFEKAIESSPNKPVEHLLLVCMGHEADLAAELQNAVPYKLDIEVVDILRDKANLEFKRDAEAEVVIEGGKILVREFFPMNLMQKLSLMKEI
jgi:adenine specific DNA methylase Mod